MRRDDSERKDDGNRKECVRMALEDAMQSLTATKNGRRRVTVV